MQPLMKCGIPRCSQTMDAYQCLEHWIRTRHNSWTIMSRHNSLLAADYVASAASEERMKITSEQIKYLIKAEK